MDEDSEVEEYLTKEYNPVEVETSIALNKEVREWNENKEQIRHCIVPVIRKVFSVVAHVGFVTCIALIIWSTQSALNLDEEDADKPQPNYAICHIIASLIASGLYIGILVEAAASETCRYLKSYSKEMTAEQYLDRTRDACPMVRWRALCYHYEPYGAGEPNTGARKNVQISQKEKVLTCDDTEAFQFNKWRDLTRDIKGLFRLPIIRLECSKIFIFRDENSKESYMHQYVNFREKSRRRDEFMDHEEIFTIPGFRERLVLCTDDRRRPCWLRESVFWVMTIFLMTWPFRIFLAKKSTKVYVVFIKELEV